MAVPKRKHSKARTNSRSANWKVKPIAASRCPQCQEPKLPHRVCLHCGTYKGRQAVQIDADK